MSHGCLTEADLARVHALSPDDPMRREAEACPRCRRQLEAYAEFLEDRSVPEGIDPRHATSRLSEAFERALREPAAVPPPRAAAPPSPRRATMGPASRTRWFAWAAAAALVIVVGLYASLRRPAGDGVDRLRAAPDSAAARDRDRPVPLAPRDVAAGIELRWSAVAGADAYRVVFLDENLAAIASLGPSAETSAVLERGRLPAGLRPGLTVAWEVEALEGGLVIATSDAGLVKLP